MIIMIEFIKVKDIILIVSFCALQQLVSPCDIPEAESCAGQLQVLYDELSTNTENGNAVEDMCISTIPSLAKPSCNTSACALRYCFQHNTEGCTSDIKEYINMQWTETNNDIVITCTSACMRYQDIGSCVNSIDYKAIEDNRFSDFCRSYNESLTCARGILAGCQFDMNFFYKLLHPNTTLYWEEICNSGCTTLDETLNIINQCWNHLDNINIDEERCHSHRRFVSCLFQENNLCPEFNTLLKSRYPNFKDVATECMTTTPTTTTTTTTPTTTTTKPTTTTTTTPTTTTTTMPTTTTTTATSTTTPSTTTTTSTTIMTTTRKQTTTTPTSTTISPSTSPTTAVTPVESTNKTLKSTTSKSTLKVIPTIEIKDELPNISQKDLSDDTTSKTNVKSSKFQQNIDLKQVYFIWAVVASALFIGLLLIVCIWCCMRKSNSRTYHTEENGTSAIPLKANET